MYSVMASVIPHLQQLALLGTVVVWWAALRPDMVRDFDNRRLPNNPTARILIALLYGVTFVALVIAYEFFSSQLIPIANSIPFFGQLMTSLEKQSSLLAILTLAGLWQIAFFREIERSLVVSLHSARHLRNDTQLLAQHLARCQLSPPDSERILNRNGLRKYGVVVQDDSPGPIDMVTVNNWRKVAALLRVVRGWNDDRGNLLSPHDVRLLDEIETAHERKTQLSMTLVKMVQQVSEGKETTKLVSHVLRMLSDAPSVDRSEIAAVEAQARALLGAESQASPGRVLKLSSQELKEYIARIESYFEVEYEILVEQIADLAAKSVVLSGAAAPERLEQLKLVGFEGLGHIERINLDRILWLFLIGLVGGFLVMFIGNLDASGRAGGQSSVEGLARFAFVMAVAGLIGAVVGSNRRHARALTPPWTVYFGAGLAAAVFYVGFMLAYSFAQELLKLAPAANQPAFELRRVLPWSLLPLMLTAAICYLARIKQWPSVANVNGGTHLIERSIDGVCVSLALLLGYYAAVSAHFLFDVPLPTRLEEMFAVKHILPIPIFLPLQAMGFLIGFFFVREVRVAAHATIVTDAVAIALPHNRRKPADTTGARLAPAAATPAE